VIWVVDDKWVASATSVQRQYHLRLCQLVGEAISRTRVLRGSPHVETELPPNPEIQSQ
jgi:hypothetical protein